ncbi:hypothetical protein [Demequina globuliformis]|uniref:hypothetical protein n=1 Tax=Demequina globuliformis TaxID=676202 RepID=UPI000AABFE7E|nr:hypothetical protein [Demequina globuliformis]
MENIFPVLFLGSIAALWWWMLKRRSGNMASVGAQAATRGYSYEPHDDAVLTQFSTATFRTDQQAARDVVRGTAHGARFVAFTHTASGDDLVAALERAHGAPLPEHERSMFQRRETAVVAVELPRHVRTLEFGSPLSEREAQIVGEQRLNVSDETFLHRWSLRHGELDVAHGELTDEVMAAMAAVDPSVLRIAFNGEYLVAEGAPDSGPLGLVDSALDGLVRVRDAVRHR